MMNILLSYVAQSHKVIEYEIITNIPIQFYSKLIDKSDNCLEDILKLLFHIYHSSWSGKKAAMVILDNIDPQIFYKKLLSYRTEEIDNVYSKISKLNKSFVMKLSSIYFRSEQK